MNTIEGVHIQNKRVRYSSIGFLHKGVNFNSKYQLLVSYMVIRTSINLGSTGATDKVVSRGSGMGDGASPDTFGVEDDSVCARRATGENTASPRCFVSIQFRDYLEGCKSFSCFFETT